jgi:transcription elongation factor Elf1
VSDWRNTDIACPSCNAGCVQVRDNADEGATDYMCDACNAYGVLHVPASIYDVSWYSAGKSLPAYMLVEKLRNEMEGGHE